MGGGHLSVSMKNWMLTRNAHEMVEEVMFFLSMWLIYEHVSVSKPEEGFEGAPLRVPFLRCRDVWILSKSHKFTETALVYIFPHFASHL